MAVRGEPRITIADGDAETARIAEFERDRRELLRRGIVAGGAVVAASSIPLLLSVRNAFAAKRGDIEILESAIKLERVSALAYDTVLDSGLLSPRVARIAKLFSGHEREHAEALVAALRALRSTPPDERIDAEDIDEVAKGIGAVKSQADVIDFAIELETSAVAAYYDAHRELIDAGLLQTAASIMANEGQHLVVLRRAAGKPPLPNALETGDES